MSEEIKSPVKEEPGGIYKVCAWGILIVGIAASFFIFAEQSQGRGDPDFILIGTLAASSFFTFLLFNALGHVVDAAAAVKRHLEEQA